MAQLQKREKILACLTGAAAVIFVVNQFVCSKKESPPMEINQTEAEATQVEPLPERPIATVPKPRPKLASGSKPVFTKWARDPFAEAYRLAQLEAAKNDSSDFVLRGVVWQGDEAHVLIGDMILREGEQKEDLKILDIKEDRVVCRKANRVVTLLLQEDEK